MSDTQTHFCKVNDFYWISNNYPSFFLFLPKKTPKIASSLPRSSLPPALPASSLPPFPEVFFRAPAEGSLPRPPSLPSVLTVHNPQPPFCLHFSCPYVSLSICAFWLSHFYSFTPSSLLSCPPIQYAYSCVLLFPPLLSLFFFPLSPCSSSPPITLQVHKIPLFSPCEIQKYPNFVTYHHFFHENLLAFQNLGIYFAPRNRNNEILSLLVSLVSPVLSFLPFPLPPRCCRGERGVESVSLLYREDSCGAYKQEHSCYNHHHRLV